jgi:hypothetical protein
MLLSADGILYSRCCKTSALCCSDKTLCRTVRRYASGTYDRHSPPSVPPWFWLYAQHCSHAVIDCNKAYLLLGEQNLSIKADLKIVSAETAHILDDNCADFPGFGFCKHCLKSGTIEVTPCVTVIFQKIVCKKFVILKIHINCNLCYSIEK